MAAPEHFADKSDSSLHRGRRPYMALRHSDLQTFSLDDNSSPGLSVHEAMMSSYGSPTPPERGGEVIE
jgi:hypothetical protein